jgi:hypothetical protein
MTQTCDNPCCRNESNGITRERLEIDEVWEFCSVKCAQRWHDLDWGRVIA